jgi:1-acyl-sn-glycerol-3-phosphate acyltransferase
VALRYTAINGVASGYRWGWYSAWIGDMPLASHLWQIMKFQSVTVQVAAGDPIYPENHASRKELARHLHATIQQLGWDKLGGR